MSGEEDKIDPTLLLGLGHTLQALPDEKFLAVIDKLELVHDSLPVAALIDEQRPRLRRLKPHRPSSLKRPLCKPFEDLLEIGPGLRQSIDRTVIDPLWRHLEECEAAPLKALQLEYRAVPIDQPRRLHEIGERLWRLTSGVLKTGPVPRLDEDVSLLLRDISLAASEIEAFKQAFPRRPIMALDDEIHARVRNDLAALADQALPTRGYLLIVASRLEQPSALVSWLRESGEPVPPNIERFALSNLADRVSSFDQDVVALDPENLAACCQTLLATLIATDHAIGTVFPSELSAQTVLVREKVRQALKARIIDKAPDGVTVALTDAPSRDALIAAEIYARALAKSRKAASQLGLGTIVDEAIATVRRHCLDRIDKLLAKSARVAEPVDPAKTKTAVFQSVRLIELADGAASGRAVLADAQKRLKAL